MFKMIGVFEKFGVGLYCNVMEFEIVFKICLVYSLGSFSILFIVKL